MAAVARLPDGRWKGGKSPNPSGRPPLTDEQREALALIKKLSHKAVQRLEALLDSSDEAMVHKAAMAILARLPIDQAGVEAAPDGQGLAEHLQWLTDKVKGREAG